AAAQHEVWGGFQVRGRPAGPRGPRRPCVGGHAFPQGSKGHGPRPARHLL
ncbi:MAG: hypothetical protein AVDCRST_MAG55-435, partial [uncultured Rubrobacteraceae bacterium]